MTRWEYKVETIGSDAFGQGTPEVLNSHVDEGWGLVEVATRADRARTTDTCSLRWPKPKVAT